MPFDLKVHHRNSKTGQIERVNPYTMHVSAEGTVFERDGILYSADGKEVGKAKAHKVASDSSIEEKVAESLHKDETKHGAHSKK